MGRLLYDRRFGFALLLALVLLAPVNKVVRFSTLDPDYFWHLRVGAALERQHWPGPLTDDLAYGSDGHPWTPYSWLAERGMYRFWIISGYRGALAVQAMVEAACFAFIALAAIEASLMLTGQPRLLCALLATLAAELLSLGYLSLRPVTIVLMLLSASAWLLLRDRRLRQTSRAVWVIPFITAVAINLHFFALFAVLATASLWTGDCIETRSGLRNDRRLRRGAILCASCLLASMLTPMALYLPRVMLDYARHDVMVHSNVIAEMGPFYRGTMGHLAAGCAVLIIVSICWRLLRPRDRRMGMGELLWVIGSAALLCRMGRMAPLFALATAPLFAATMPTLSDKLLGAPGVIAVALLAVLGNVTLVFRDFPRARQPISAWLNRLAPNTPGYPCEAADFVAAKIEPRSGRIICEFTWGGYLEWRLNARFQLLMDGRTQVFDRSFWESTYFGSLQDRMRIARWGAPDAAVLPREGSIFLPALQQLRWTCVYEDATAMVLTPPEKNQSHSDVFPDRASGDRVVQDGCTHSPFRSNTLAKFGPTGSEELSRAHGDSDEIRLHPGLCPVTQH